MALMPVVAPAIAVVSPGYSPAYLVNFSEMSPSASDKGAMESIAAKSCSFFNCPVLYPGCSDIKAKLMLPAVLPTGKLRCEFAPEITSWVYFLFPLYPNRANSACWSAIILPIPEPSRILACELIIFLRSLSGAVLSLSSSFLYAGFEATILSTIVLKASRGFIPLPTAFARLPERSIPLPLGSLIRAAALAAS